MYQRAALSKHFPNIAAIYFEELFNGKLEIDGSYVWEMLTKCCSLIHPKELVGDIEKAIVEEKVMKILVDLDFMDAQLEKSVEEVLEELKEDSDYSFITEEDIVSLEQWVGNFGSEDDYDEDEDEYPFNEDEKNEMIGNSLTSCGKKSPTSKLPCSRSEGVGGG